MHGTPTRLLPRKPTLRITGTAQYAGVLRLPQGSQQNLIVPASAGMAPRPLAQKTKQNKPSKVIESGHGGWTVQSRESLRPNKVRPSHKNGPSPAFILDGDKHVVALQRSKGVVAG